MANKRNLKKYVRYTCGALASEILLARAAFPTIQRKDVHAILSDIALLQSATITKASVSFDKKCSDFENRGQYNKARSEYYKLAYAKLFEQFNEGIENIVKKMNSALPAEVRAIIKDAAGK